MMSSGSYSSRNVDMVEGAHWELDKMEIRALEHVTHVGIDHVIAVCG
jgi:hypothetical protein